MRWTFGTGKRGKPRQRLLWQQVQNIPNSIIINTKVLFKTVKQGTCFSPMWRRLERWWRNWGRYCEDIYILSIPIMVRILMTMQKKILKERRCAYLTDESLPGCTRLGRHAQNCALDRYQGQSRFVSIFAFKFLVFYNICHLVPVLLSCVFISVLNICSGFWNWFRGGANGVGLYWRHRQVDNNSHNNIDDNIEAATPREKSQQANATYIICQSLTRSLSSV